VNAEAKGRIAAAQFRHKHHVGVQPLGDLVTVIEQATGIDVAVLDVGPDFAISPLKPRSKEL
jgi:hypothetical protein